jgi:hypothetical protein
MSTVPIRCLTLKVGTNRKLQLNIAVLVLIPFELIWFLQFECRTICTLSIVNIEFEKSKWQLQISTNRIFFICSTRPP